MCEQVIASATQCVSLYVVVLFFFELTKTVEDKSSGEVALMEIP